MILEGQGRDPNMFDAIISETAGDKRLNDNGAPIRNGNLRIKWSCDWWRHMTLKGLGRDPDMLNAKYLKNGWR